jgi:hypothetical protein
MAKTNFSGPITSGNIRNTTGTTVGTNVRNVGFTEVSQTFPVDYSMFVFDDDSLVTTAGGGAAGTSAGTLTQVQDFVMPNSYGGVYGAALVSINSSANDSGITFTITGTDINGKTQTEGAITGPSSTTVQSTLAYKTVTSIVTSGTLTGNVKIGYDGAVTTTKVQWPLRSNFNVDPQGQTATSVNSGELLDAANLANNIVIPKNSRVTYIRGIVPAGLVFDFGGATTFGFGTTSYNNAGTIEVDEDYFSLSATANAKAAAFYDTLTDFGNVSAAMYTNHLNVSNADSGSGTSTGEIDKELMLVMNIANGTTPTAGEMLVVVNYLQQVNTTN